MSKTAKWITGIATAMLCLAVLALTAVWRLGLLPLLFPPQPAPVSAVEIIQPNGEIYLSPHGNSTNNVQPGNGHTGSNVSAPVTDKTATNTGNSGGWASKSQLQQEIEAKYITRLSNLGNDYEEQLNSLVSEAYNEYSTDKKQGHHVSAMVLANKYLPMGNSLEKQCDDQFYTLLNQFEDELQSNGLPLATAIRAQQVYEYDKAIRKKNILTAAARMI
jgi:hypothetical protein